MEVTRENKMTDFLDKALIKLFKKAHYDGIDRVPPDSPEQKKVDQKYYMRLRRLCQKHNISYTRDYSYWDFDDPIGTIGLDAGVDSYADAYEYVKQFYDHISNLEKNGQEFDINEEGRLKKDRGIDRPPPPTHWPNGKRRKTMREVAEEGRKKFPEAFKRLKEEFPHIYKDEE